jgi:hypothetical protein
MRRTLALAAGSLLLATALSAAPCAPSPTTLCLNDSRFEVEVSWRDSRGRTGAGQAKTITADTGYFWFFSEANIELVIKVLDARSINGKYWVFFGALSSVEYDLTVTDTMTGAVKTYHNPLGQFASVGDTGAFDPGVTAPSRDVVQVAGDAAGPRSLEALQAFIEAPPSPASAKASTPCKTVASTLVLNDCRFGLNVEWTDSRGRTGRGTPVSLTNDTGYFWFFNAANVELVIKVLDARSINGSFWVFYGALSNVDYTLTVSDSLTGEVKVYRNRSGSFASVGDTAAFHAGREVVVSKDSGRAVTATIDPEGGSLSADAADGTHFVLNLPPDAVSRPTAIRMTPLSEINGLPFSRGFIGGVQLEPEGLRLFVPATLTIRPAGPMRPGAVGFSYLADGDEFALDLSKKGNGQIELQVLHFSGYGAGNATPGNISSQSSIVPASVIQAIRQRIAAIFDRATEREDENGNVIPPELTQEQAFAMIVEIVADAFDRHLRPALASLAPECNRTNIEAVVSLALATIHTAEYMGLDNDLSIRGWIDDTINRLIAILQQCEQKAFDVCKQHQDPLQAFTMVMIERQLQLFGVETLGLLEPGGLIERCLRFELNFDSTVTLPIDPTGGTFKVPVSARVPLRMDPSISVRDVSWKGTGTTRIGDALIDPLPACTVSAFHTTTGNFSVGVHMPAWLIPLAMNRFESPGYFTAYDITFGYEPGDPEFSYSLRCVVEGEVLNFDYPSVGLWRSAYLVNHLFDSRGELGFLAEGWEVLARPGIYARKTYSGNILVTEDTTLLLKHTPDAAN